MEQVYGIPFNYLFKSLNLSIIGTICIIIFALTGFLIGTFKIPNLEAFKVTRLVGGENIDDVIVRYIKFKNRKNKIYITKEEEN